MYKAATVAAAAGLVLAFVVQFRVEESQPGYERFTHPRNVDPPFYGAYCLSAIVTLGVPVVCYRWTGPSRSALWAMAAITALVGALASPLFVYLEFGHITPSTWPIWGAAAMGAVTGALGGVSAGRYLSQR